MEEELCYYRRLLFAGNPAAFTPPSSETSVTYANSNSWGAQAPAYSTPPSNGSSSTHSSPTLSNIPGDFGPVSGGVDNFWGYEVPEVAQTPQYQDFKYADTSSAYLGQGQQW